MTFWRFFVIQKSTFVSELLFMYTCLVIFSNSELKIPIWSGGRNVLAILWNTGFQLSLKSYRNIGVEGKCVNLGGNFRIVKKGGLFC